MAGLSDDRMQRVAILMKCAEDSFKGAAEALKQGCQVTAMECVTEGRRAVTDAAVELEQVSGSPITAWMASFPFREAFRATPGEDWKLS